MSNTRAPYPPEFRRQMVELVEAGRSPEELAREFEPSAQAIRNWVSRRKAVLAAGVEKVIRSRSPADQLNRTDSSRRNANQGVGTRRILFRRDQVGGKDVEFDSGPQHHGGEECGGGDQGDDVAQPEVGHHPDILRVVARLDPFSWTPNQLGERSP